MQKHYMEFLGTFFLVLAIGMTGSPLVFGLMLAAMIYMGGHISGAHYNPAITLSMFFRGHVCLATVFEYALAQIGGAFVASAVVYGLTGNIFYVAIPHGIFVWQAGLMEILATFVLCSVVLTTTTNSLFKGNHIYGLAIGLTLLSAAVIASPISGGCLNPAVSLGSNFFGMLMRGNPVKEQVLMYVIAPLIGGLLAAYSYRYLNNESK